MCVDEGLFGLYFLEVFKLHVPAVHIFPKIWQVLNYYFFK